MNKKKLIIIIGIVLALLLIIGGIVFVVSNKEAPKEIKEQRDYKTVVTNAPTTEGEMSSVEDVQETFEEDAKDIGFEKAECDESGSCLATNKGYTNTEYEDVINVAKDEYGDPTMVVVLYFHKNDCTADNIFSKLNAASNNYFGSKVSKDAIQKVLNQMENASDKFGQEIITAGDYTIDLSIQYVEGKDFRVVKYRVITTALYNEYQGA